MTDSFEDDQRSDRLAPEASLNITDLWYRISEYAPLISEASVLGASLLQL